MLYRWIIVLVSFLLCIQSTGANSNAAARLRRQETGSSTLTSLTTSNTGSAPSTTPDSSSSSLPSLTSSTANSDSAAASSSGSSAAASSSQQLSTSRSSSRTTSVISSTTAASSASATATPGKDGDTLPIQPHITPALGIAGVILILTGTAYTLVGIKNKWIQIFLSSAYLVSISVTVLINYVMSPQISDAIQGAYFVAIFMTGCIFGAGALIFKEITEGLGCLLGGFCLGMWFLTLKSGGIVTSSTGRGILLGVFMIVCWAFSFSSHTRAYALIGSTSFAGATAFTLGVDCFTRVGLKEFWLYLWGLNPNLFPLNTNTYPITRGIRVEIAVIVLGCLIGVISQLKLWKKIKARRDEKEAIRVEEDGRRDAVDEALGRHLERQNERAKQQWEMLYGDPNKRPNSMVDSVLEPDESGGRVSVMSRRMYSGLNTREVVEMKKFDARRSNTHLKRQSGVAVSAIPEELEDHENGELSRTTDNNHHGPADENESTREPSLTIGSSIKDPTTPVDASSVGSTESKAQQTQQKKRNSVQTFFKRISGHYPSSPDPLTDSPPQISQEALFLPQMHHSRASSLAATIDEDDDKADLKRLSTYNEEGVQPPTIIVSPALQSFDVARRRSFLEIPPSPPAMSVEFDPEELTRPVSPTAEMEVPSTSQSRDQTPSRYSTSERKSSSGKPQLPDSPAKAELTPGALQNIPSQLSNVILSYRTNEWAKHITTADAPEEPRGVVGDMKDEPATQVITNLDIPPSEPQSPVERVPSESSSAIDRTLSPATKPPTPHIIPKQESTLKSNSSAESESQLVDQIRQNSSVVDCSRVMSTSSRPGISIGRGIRSSSTPMLSQSQSLVASPIDENAAVIFPVVDRSSTYPDPASAAILAAQRQSLLRNKSSITAQRSSSALDLPMRSNSRISLINDMPDRSTSAMSGRITPLQYGAISRPDTRLSSYDSRQPQRQSTGPTPEQRETMLARWRNSMRNEVAVEEHPEQTLGQRRADMLAAKQQSAQNAQQQQYMQMHKETAMDQMMRRGDMQQLHREAMRKMQAGVNKNITK